MKFQFIENHRSSFPDDGMCEALNVSVSGYYAYHKRDKSHQHQENQRLLVEIRIVFKKSRETYGSPRITAYLRFKGYSCGKNRVARLMKANGIRVKTQRRYKATTNSKHSYPVAENLLSQEFIAYKPNQIWVSDITYIPTQEGWLSFTTILDLFSRMVNE